MATELDGYRSSGERIESLIRPATFPLAVRLIGSETEIQPEYKRPSRDMAAQNFVCQNFKMARSYGWTIAVTEADINCKAARVIYGWDKPTDEEKKWAKAFSVGLYAKDEAVAGTFERHLYSLDSDFAGMIISPWHGRRSYRTAYWYTVSRPRRCGLSRRICSWKAGCWNSLQRED